MFPQCEVINDFNFPEEDSKIGKKHFEIKYDISVDEYKIKGMIGNNGLYIKISNKVLLRNHSVFSFGGIHITSEIAFDQSTLNSTITLKVIYGLNQGQEM